MKHLNGRTQNKKICLLAPGASLDDSFLRNDYDIVCGLNRTYKTKYCKYLDVLFHNASIFDNPLESVKQTREINENCDIVFLPRIHYSEPGSLASIDRCVLNDDNCYSLCYYKLAHEQVVGGHAMYSGIIALDLLLSYSPKTIDIYGMDFYSGNTKYINDMKYFGNDVHNQEVNYLYFQSLMEKHNNINWILSNPKKQKIKKMFMFEEQFC